MKDKRIYLYHGLTWIILGILVYWRRQELCCNRVGILWPFIPFIFGLLIVVEFGRTAEGPHLTGHFWPEAVFLLLFSTEILSWPGIGMAWPFLSFLQGPPFSWLMSTISPIPAFPF